jgi:16S rRNA (guanine527-N7)-methyltransferase
VRPLNANDRSDRERSTDRSLRRGSDRRRPVDDRSPEDRMRAGGDRSPADRSSGWSNHERARRNRPVDRATDMPTTGHRLGGDPADGPPARGLPGVAGGRPPADWNPPEALLPIARSLFGDRLPLAIEYARLLATDGVVRGVIGPREAPRIWERHLLNCAAISELISPAASVVDVGSGAGLPGIVLAVARPDLSVILVEPLARRTAFLTEVVTALGLEHTRVVRARAEECVGSPRSRSGRTGLALADVVTARALAPLDRLAAWCLPLAAEGGRVLALKGVSAVREVDEHRTAIARLGGNDPSVLLCGAGLLDSPTTVVEIVRGRSAGPAGRVQPSRSRRSPSGG